MTLTFKYDTPEETAISTLKRTLRRINRSVYGRRSARRLRVFAVKELTAADRIHFHLLVGGETPKHTTLQLRHEFATQWVKPSYTASPMQMDVYGDEWFKPVNDDCVVDYCLKNLTCRSDTVIAEVLSL